MNRDLKFRWAVCCLLAIGALTSTFKASATIFTASNTDQTGTSVTKVININCDMVELPFSSGNRLRVIAWDDLTSPSIRSYFQVWDESSATATAAIALPVGSSYPDVVIADDPNNLGTQYKICVVYVLAANVVFRTYQVTGIGTSVSVSATPASTVTLSTGNSSDGPHIDLAPDPNTLVNSTTPALLDFAINWAQSSAGVIQLKGVYGNINTPTTTSLLPMAAGMPTNIAVPDISCMYDDNTGDIHAYSVYVDVSNNIIRVDDANLSTSASANALATTPSPTFARFNWPRIESQGINNNTSGQAKWMLVMGAMNPVGTPYKVLMYDSRGLNTSPGNLSNGLSNTVNNTFTAIAAGSGILSGFTSNMGNNQYTTVLHPVSDTYLYDSPIPLSGCAGFTNDYYEANLTSITTSLLLPAVAVSSSSNTGLGTLTAWWDGSNVMYKTTGNSMSFRPTSVASTAMPAVTLYPNPTTNSFTLGGIDNANYTITDMAGKTVMHNTIAKGDVVNVDALANGAYIISIKENGNQRSLQFVKQ